MSTHKYIDRICCVVVILTVVLTVVFMNGESFGIQAASKEKGYESRLFDTSRVHTIDIIMEDWEGFLDTCTNEEYSLCSVVIDNEAYKNVAIRAKGNTSLTQVASYGNDRYSFKIEFDHYDSTKNYHGLDKLSLNNIIQDNTYLKDYLSYQMMGYFGVDAPLCSFVYITVNGEDWGLYLAVEGVEEAFLERNYGSNYGELYKPDSQSMGGGRGNGGKFDMDDWQPENGEEIQPQNGGDTRPEIGMQQGNTTPSPKDLDLDQLKSMLNRLDETALQEVADILGYADTTSMLAALDDAESLESFLNENDLSVLASLLRGNGDNNMMAPPDMNNDNLQQSDGEGAPQMPGGGMNEGRGGMGGSMGSDDVSLVYTDDEYSSYQNIFDNAKTDITDADKDRLIASLKQLNENENIDMVVDVDEVIRYFVVHNFVCNFDSYTGSMIHNYYLYEEDGQLSMIPWDYNLAFGGFQGAQDATALVNYPIDTPVSGGTVESRPMLAWIFSNEEYTELYHKYFSEFISGYFDSGYFSEMIEKVEAMISPYVEKDPTKFCTFEEFETGIATLKEFCLLRAESIDGQLSGAIASTSEGQSQNSESLIDASDINISDMGTMNNNDRNPMGNTGFQGDARPQNFGQEEEPFSQNNEPSSSEGKTDPFEGNGLPPEEIPDNPNAIGENSQDGLSQKTEGSSLSPPADAPAEDGQQNGSMFFEGAVDGK